MIKLCSDESPNNYRRIKMSYVKAEEILPRELLEAIQ